jgi:hypothetical protein
MNFEIKDTICTDRSDSYAGIQLEIDEDE